jgi:hypothetical protein
MRQRTCVSAARFTILVRLGVTLLMVGVAVADRAQGAEPNAVRLRQLPDGHIQPMARVDASGTVHLIYFTGDPVAGDVYYVRRPVDAADFSDPLRVNSQPASVIAIGTVRGAHLALGTGGRPHVAWMGSDRAEPRGPDGQSPMLYSRLDIRGEFEPQRNLVTHAFGLDGGGTVAADAHDRVSVLWHADAGEGGEEWRRVWMTTSTDGGSTFGPEVAVSEPGACGCCGMSAAIDRAGTTRALYRGFAPPDHRDMFLLSADGRTFERDRIEGWRLGACPMSTSSISTAAARDGDGDDEGVVTLAWETAGEVAWATVAGRPSAVSEAISPLSPGDHRKHPVVARAADGRVLFVWTEGMAWNQGGTLHWQEYDPRRQPTGVRGSTGDIPAWSRPAAIAERDGSFTILY